VGALLRGAATSASIPFPEEEYELTKEAAAMPQHIAVSLRLTVALPLLIRGYAAEVEA
jgi:hypothetical protein